MSNFRMEVNQVITEKKKKRNSIPKILNALQLGYQDFMFQMLRLGSNGKGLGKK